MTDTAACLLLIVVFANEVWLIEIWCPCICLSLTRIRWFKHGWKSFSISLFLLKSICWNFIVLKSSVFARQKPSRFQPEYLWWPRFGPLLFRQKYPHNDHKLCVLASVKEVTSVWTNVQDHYCDTRHKVALHSNSFAEWFLWFCYACICLWVSSFMSPPWWHSLSQQR